MNVLEKVYAAPDDDAAKLVAADALLEVNDPRGEFITLQFKAWNGEATRADRARIAALLSKHRERWLGTLAEVTDPERVVFEKGFLRECALHERALEHFDWLSAPALREVRELGLPELEAPSLRALLRRPELQHLLGPRLASARVLERLASEAAFSFTSFGLRGQARALVPGLVTVAHGTAFARVTRLACTVDHFTRSAVAELLKGFTTHGLQTRFASLHLESTNNDSSALGFALTQARRLAPHALISVSHPHLAAQLDSTGTLTVRSATNAAHAIGFLRALDLAQVGLTVHQSGGPPPAESELDLLKNDLRRLRPRAMSLPAEWGLADV